MNDILTPLRACRSLTALPDDTCNFVSPVFRFLSGPSSPPPPFSTKINRTNKVFQWQSSQTPPEQMAAASWRILPQSRLFYSRLFFLNLWKGLLFPHGRLWSARSVYSFWFIGEVRSFISVKIMIN